MQNDHAPKIEGPNAILDLTMLISGPKHPKNIYGMSLFCKRIENQFEIELKFKFELKQKRKRKEKEKKQKGHNHLGWPRPKAQLIPLWPRRTGPSGQRWINQKKRKRG